MFKTILRNVLWTCALLPIVGWGEVLVVDRNMVVDSSRTVTGIRFTTTATLSAAPGVTVTVTGGDAVVVQAGTATVTCPVEFSGGSEQLVSAAANTTLNLNGVLSGTAPIRMQGAASTSSFFLRGANTFTGALVCKTGRFYFYGDVFGTQDADTLFDNPGNLTFVYFRGVTTHEAFRFNNSSGTRFMYFGDSEHAGAVNEFFGDFTCQTGGNQGPQFLGSSTTTFHGKLVSFWCFTATVDSGSKIFFDSNNYFNNTWYLGGGGECHFRTQSYLTSQYGFHVGGVYYSLECDDALGYNGAHSRLWFENGSVIDCCGHDQTYEYIFSSTNASTPSSVIKNTSATPCTLHLLQWNTRAVSSGGAYLNTATNLYDGIFAGNLSVSLENAKPLRLSNASTATGTLSLTNGALLVMSPKSKWIGNVTVKDTSRIHVDGANAFSDDTVLSVETTARIRLDSGMLRVKKLIVGGHEVEGAGTWGASGSEADHVSDVFEGPGVIFPIDSQTLVGGTGTWDGGAGTADEQATNPLNWVDDTLPDLASGLGSVSFATGGVRAELPQKVNVKGVALRRADAAAPSFTIGGSGPLVVGANGLTVAEVTDGVMRDYAVSAPYAALESQTWAVPGTNTLTLGAVSGASGAKITKNGSGVLRLDGPLSVPGTFLVNAGKVYLKDGDSLGTAGSAFLLSQSTGGYLYATNKLFTTAAALTLNGEAQKTGFDVAAGSTNIFTGPVTLNGPSINVTGGAVARFRGGVTVSGWFWIKGVNGRLVIEDKPLNCSGVGIYHYTANESLVLAAPSNTCGNEVFIYQNSTLICAAPWAFAYPNSKIIMGRNTGTNAGSLDLGGYDQGFINFNGYAVEPTEAGARCWVKSATPASAHWRVAADGGVKTNFFYFGGYAGLVKEGSGTAQLMSPSPSSNTLAVAEGTLTFGDGVRYNGSWLNATNVVVSGGRLVLDRADRINPDADYTVSGTGVIEIPEGVMVKARSLTYPDAQGNPRTSVGGLYVGPEGRGGRVLSNLAGKGILRVGTLGTMIIFR